MISGEGSVGKSILLLQLAVAHVIARDWIGTMPTPGPAIYFCAEDDRRELHRRLDDIRNHHIVRYTDLSAGGLHVVSFAGQDATLGAPDRAGIIRPTPLFERLRNDVLARRPVNVILDPVADIFGGDEISRMQVRQFAGLLQRADANQRNLC